MKFIKGVVVGGIVTAGLAMIWADTIVPNKRKMIKKGKQIAKKMGISV